MSERDLVQRVRDAVFAELRRSGSLRTQLSESVLIDMLTALADKYDGLEARVRELENP